MYPLVDAFRQDNCFPSGKHPSFEVASTVQHVVQAMQVLEALAFVQGLREVLEGGGQVKCQEIQAAGRHYISCILQVQLVHLHLLQVSSSCQMDRKYTVMIRLIHPPRGGPAQFEANLVQPCPAL